MSLVPYSMVKGMISLRSIKKCYYSYNIFCYSKKLFCQSDSTKLRLIENEVGNLS